MAKIRPSQQHRMLLLTQLARITLLVALLLSMQLALLEIRSTQRQVLVLSRARMVLPTHRRRRKKDLEVLSVALPRTRQSVLPQTRSLALLERIIQLLAQLQARLLRQLERTFHLVALDQSLVLASPLQQCRIPEQFC